MYILIGVLYSIVVIFVATMTGDTGFIIATGFSALMCMIGFLGEDVINRLRKEENNDI